MGGFVLGQDYSRWSSSNRRKSFHIALCLQVDHKQTENRVEMYLKHGLEKASNASIYSCCAERSRWQRQQQLGSHSTSPHSLTHQDVRNQVGTWVRQRRPSIIQHRELLLLCNYLLYLCLELAVVIIKTPHKFFFKYNIYLHKEYNNDLSLIKLGNDFNANRIFMNLGAANCLHCLTGNKTDLVRSGHICQTGDYWGSVNVLPIHNRFQSKVLQNGC